MLTMFLVIHGIITVMLIGVILLQRNSGDGLAIGGGGGNNFMTGRGTANFMTRTTAVLATIFIISSLSLAIYMSRSSQPSIADKIAGADASGTATPVEASVSQPQDGVVTPVQAAPVQPQPASVPKPE